MTASMLSRRAMLGGMGAGCLCCAGGVRAATGFSADAMASEMQRLSPLVVPGFRPGDNDERGLWQSLEKAEADIADSPLRVRDPALEGYVQRLTEGLIGDNKQDIRCYIVRQPVMNASMAPNGMMQVYSGALLRFRDEAELAAVLGHECGHYLRRHQISSWRQRRNAAAWTSFLTVGLAIAGGAAGINNGSTIQSLNESLALSIFQYQRAQESEADTYGLKLLEAAGYQPEAASQFWRGMIAEQSAGARMRGQRKERPSILFASHPSDESRMFTLAAEAQFLAASGKSYRDGRAPYHAALSPMISAFLDDQVKLNDPGASLFIIDRLATDGWNGLLHYQTGEVYRLRGESGDGALALAAYRDAVGFADAPAQAYRAFGYGLLKTGAGDDGKAQLRRYLAMTPQADDRAMIEFTLNQ